MRVSVGTDRIVTSRRVMFKSGHSEFTREGTAVIAAVARAFLRTRGDTMLVVEGHTDGNGNADVNLHLSRVRAEVVARALERYGVDPARIAAVGLGAAQPLVDKDAVDSYRNRRIDFRLMPFDAALVAARATHPVAVAPKILSAAVAPAAQPPTVLARVEPPPTSAVTPVTRPRIAFVDDGDEPAPVPRPSLEVSAGAPHAAPRIALLLDAPRIAMLPDVPRPAPHIDLLDDGARPGPRLGTLLDEAPQIGLLDSDDGALHLAPLD